MRSWLVFIVGVSMACSPFAHREPRRDVSLPAACGVAAPFVTVRGEVNRPGKVACTLPIDLPEVIKRAGGFDALAWEVVVRRRTCAGRYATLRVRGENLARVILMPGDDVEVRSSD